MILSQGTEALEHAARTISNGGVIAFRTDTFYGLGADPLNSLAVGRISHLKGRAENKPILLLVSDYDKVAHFITEPSELFHSIASRHWPGPLTLVGSARPELPRGVNGGKRNYRIAAPQRRRRAFSRTCLWRGANGNQR